MKSGLIVIALVLFYACENKNKVIVTENNSVQEKIRTCYIASIYKNPTTSPDFCQDIEALEKLAASESNEYQAMIAIVAGMQNSNKSHYQLGLKNYQDALALLQNSKVDSLKARTLNGIGNNYKVTGDYKKAIQNLYPALGLYEKTGDSLGIGSVYTILSDVYFQMDQLDKAKTSIEKALNFLKNKKSSPMYLSAAHSLANYYGMNGEFDKALALDKMGIRICDSLSLPKMKVSFLDNKANCYLFSNQMDSAYFYFNECLKMDLKLGNKKQIADTYSNIGQFFLMKKDYKAAEEEVQKSISLLKTVEGKPNLDKSYAILSEIYTSQNQFQKAFAVQKEKMANYKAMLQEREASAAAEYHIVYETQKKEAKIQFLELENKVRELKIQQQQLQVKRSNILMLLAVLLLLFVMAVVYFWYQHQKVKSILERKLTVQKTEEAERIRMSKDIHDDLGSGLSKINFLSELISQQTNNIPDIKHNTDAIKETAKKMIDNMRDLIWSMNPENATLANLVARMREHTTDYLEDYSIEIAYAIPDNLPQTFVNNEVHRALFLVVKEALHNIVKHAAANQIEFKITITDTEFQLNITDNGRGFTLNESGGNGLKNMKSRIERVGGNFRVESTVGEKTMVYFDITLDVLFKK